MSYTYKIDNEIKIKRIDSDMLEFSIDGKKAKILTEDLAALITAELPEDRAKDMLSAVEEKAVSKGKMRLVIEAKRDIKKGDFIRTSVDVTRYLEKANAQAASETGILLPKFSGVRTNNAGLIF